MELVKFGNGATGGAIAAGAYQRKKAQEDKEAQEKALTVEEQSRLLGIQTPPNLAPVNIPLSSIGAPQTTYEPNSKLEELKFSGNNGALWTWAYKTREKESARIEAQAKDPIYEPLLNQPMTQNRSQPLPIKPPTNRAPINNHNATITQLLQPPAGSI